MSDGPRKTLIEIRDMATELDGINQAIDLLMGEVQDSKGMRHACFTLASLAKDRSQDLALALDDYTTRNPG